MSPIIRFFEHLRPGDILSSKDAVPRWIGSLSWYAGKFCNAGDQFMVTDVYPSGIRVVSPDGGIHFFIGRRSLKLLRYVRHDRKPSDEVAKRHTPNRMRGSWPYYRGSYRPQSITPESRVRKISPPVRVSSGPKTFAVNAKQRQSGKTGINKPTKTKQVYGS